MDYPRPQQVAAGVSWFAARTPTLPPATHTNSYALGERALLLVEPATPHDDEQRAWLSWARGLASQGRRLMAIFATHHHPDHVGGAAFFADALGLPLWAHAETAARLPELHIARTLVDGETLTLEGPTPQEWTCLHTPGHAPGHLCLHDAERGVLIVGDMVASEGTILIAPGEGDLAMYLRQLARLLDLNATLALPAHGAPITDPPAIFSHYIRHRGMRQDKVIAALARHPQGADLDALVADAYDDTPAYVWPIAKLSLESHLLKLRDEGLARTTNDRWLPKAEG